MSGDGQNLALVGYLLGRRLGVFPFAKATVFTFQNRGGNLFFSKKMGKQRAPGWPFARQYEAIAFSGERQLTISNEKLLWQKPKIRSVRLLNLKAEQRPIQKK